MAQIKDLLVNGSARVIGTIYGNATSATNSDKLDGKHLNEIASAKSTTLAWNTSSTIATIGGNNITVTMPANPNTDTHWTTGITAGATGTTSNSATTNGNTFIKIKDNSTHRGQIKLVGSGATSISSDANGVITISSTDNNTTYGSMSIDEGTTGTATSNRVLTAANLKGIINAHAPTKTGSGASGNWGISITGNAATASKVNNKLTVGSKTFNGSAAVTIAASDLGLASAMLFLGTTTTSITDGATTNPVAIGGSNKTVTAGNVVLYGSKEFVWTGSAWEELGNEGSYKIVQAAVGDPSASGTSNTFIATISQDTNGKITATKKTVAVTNSAPTLSWGATSTVGTVAGTNLQVKMPANPNTWRGIQNNLTSDSTTDSLAAAQGKALKALIDGKAAFSHTHNYAGSSSAGGAANSAVKLSTARTITLSGAVTGSASFDGSKNITITTTGSQQTLPYSSSTSQLFVTTTANQANYTLSNFVDNAVYYVYVNGFKIPSSEYTVSSSGVVTLANPPELANQEVEIVANYTSYVTTDSSINNSSYLNYYRQATAPSNTNALWLDTSATTSSSSFTPKLYDGGKWNAIGGSDTSVLDARYIKKSGDTMTGDLTAPTFHGALDGNATNADKLDGYHFSDLENRYVKKSGDIMSGTLKFNDSQQIFFKGKGNSDSVYCKMGFMNGVPAGVVHCVNNYQTDGAFYITSNGYNAGNDHGGIAIDNEGVTVFGAGDSGNNFTGVFRVINEDNISAGPVFRVQKDGKAYATALYGAVWNDYAEYRKSEELEPGRCVIENGDGSLSRSFGRLEPGAEIVSDTFGFAIGETDECKTPLAVSGRVLAYPYEDKNSYKPGDPVCSGPNGTISKMTREEVREYPDRMIGTVSEIPLYEEWGSGKVKINGRIWIRIK